MTNTEEYVVKYWCVNSDGWKEQREEAYERWYREWVRASIVYVPIDSVLFNR